VTVRGFRPRIPGAPRRGEVYDWESRKVLILSNDHYNEDFDPLCVLVVRNAPPSEYVIALGEADPYSGRVVVGPIFPVPAAEMGEAKGTVTGATLARVGQAVQLLLSDD
jgi:mRNA interferase MazF